jgi:hypothetical protein
VFGYFSGAVHVLRAEMVQRTWFVKVRDYQSSQVRSGIFIGMLDMPVLLTLSINVKIQDLSTDGGG